MKYTFEVKDEKYLAHYGTKGMKWGKRKKHKGPLRPQPKVSAIVTKEGTIYVNENDTDVKTHTKNKHKKYRYEAGITEDTRRRLESQGYKRGSYEAAQLYKKYGLYKDMSLSEAKKWREERDKKKKAYK